MEASEPKSGGRTLLAVFVTLVILGLIGAIFYLASDINRRRYRLMAVEGNLVVQQGRMLPLGFTEIEVEAEDLKAAYAPIPLPPGEARVATEIFDDRADVDRALFALLAGWARQRFDANEPGSYELAATYVRRGELLPGLSEEQRLELRTMRADLAYMNGRRLLSEVGERLNKALASFKQARELGSTRGKDVERWIADVERRIRDYQQGTQEPAPAAPAAPPPGAPSEEAAPPKGEEQPKWRL
ncbi:MAG: hypothetical protein HYZ27_07405 [Deltaproteobacteria bacterium]|nr:hypothetical protein [Deltaproteobacteria bacterium]